MLKWKLPKIEYTKNISMFRNFTNVVAGTGAIFAALHVFIGYMGFDGTADEATGEVPRFFDQEEYRYYLFLAVLFLLTVVVSAVFRRFPAITLLPSVATTTYLLLLLDAEILVTGKMTFIMFSLFVLAGNVAVSLYAKGRLAREIYRYVICFIALVAAGWAITIYFRAPLAADQLFGAVKPIEALDGLAAVQRYERLELLTKSAEEGHTANYLYLALLQILSAAGTLFLMRWKRIVRLISLIPLSYMLVVFTFGELSYFPMFCVVPMLAYFVGCQALCTVGDGNEVQASTDSTDGAELTEVTVSTEPTEKAEGENV